MVAGAGSEEDPPSPAEPLVLLGDPLTGGREWQAARPFLAAALHLVDVDGPIGPERARAPAPDNDDGLAEEIERREQFPAHLLASSFAAAPAIRLASRRPELVRSLLLHDPIVVSGATDDRPTVSPEEVRDLFAPAAAELEAGHLARAGASFAEAWGGDAEDARGILDALSGSDRSAVRWLAQYRAPGRWEVPLQPTEEVLAPTLVVTGELSPPWLRRVSQAVAARLPNVTAVELPGATHFDPWRNPTRFAGVVLTFCLERNVPVT